MVIVCTLIKSLSNSGRITKQICFESSILGCHETHGKKSGFESNCLVFMDEEGYCFICRGVFCILSLSCPSRLYFPFTHKRFCLKTDFNQA